jgi:hypothetical protein
VVLSVISVFVFSCVATGLIPSPRNPTNGL